jgi:glycosyltransferase involved in cell wall biosynthesis
MNTVPTKALTLSIVIPVYNEENYIGRCLEAIQQQTHPPDEVLIIDNNSTDATIDIARQFPFTRVLVEPKQGLFHARQTGMDAARGDIIGRIDADTFVDTAWVAEVKKGFENPTLSAVTGPFAYHDMPLPEVGLRLDLAARRIVTMGGYSFLAGANMAMRRQAWHMISGELCNKPYLFEDIDIVQHLREHGLTPLYNPRMRAAMSSRRYADKPRDFVKYIGGHTRTLQYHNQPTPWGVHFAEGIFSLGYVILKPLHHAFDPVERRLSMTRLMDDREARPDPMSTER